ncbi:non-ribosomal peptide synthetase [Hydrogenophaga sp. A37]
MHRVETMSPKDSCDAQTPIAQRITLRELLRERTADLGDLPAYVFLGSDLEPAQALSYAALGQSAETIARKLRGLTQAGDRVLLAFSNDLEAVQLFWGCILARTLPIPAPAPDTKNVRGSEARLRGIAVDANVALALTHESHVETGRGQIPDVRWHSLQTLLALPQGVDPAVPAAQWEGPADAAYLQYTSGSTSAPRGVEITHGNVLAQCAALMRRLDTHGKRGLIWLPWFHDYGLIHGVIQPLYSGATAFLMPTAQFLLRPLRWLEAIEKHGVTHSGAPDFAYVACVKALARAPGWTARLDNWQVASCGAEPVRATTLNAFAEAFAPFGFHNAALAPSYGLAEAVLAVTVRDTHTPLLQLTLDAQAIERHEVQHALLGAPGTRTLVGCGPPLPGFELCIVDPDTSVPCLPHRIGEIWVAGPSVGRGYWGQPEASAEHFGATLAHAGADPTHHLRTGDLGFMHEGELFVAGRLKDLILVNGRNLYPHDLEQTAEASHPNIRSGGVIAISVDKGLKETAVMLVECSRRPAPDAVRELLDGVQEQVGIEHQLDLHDIVPLPAGALPRTSSGKPMRGAARRLYLQGALEPLRLAAEAPPLLALPQNGDADAPLIDTLTQVWSDVLEHDGIQPDANFFDLGGDSLLATQLVSRLRTRLGVELPISALFESPTVRGLARRVGQAQEQLSHSRPHPTVGPATRHGVRAPGARVTLSHSQERMWFMHELAPHSSAYNVPLAIRLWGLLDLAALQTALEQVVERHEILRTRFIKSPEGAWGEVVSAPPPLIDEVRLALDGAPVSDGVLHRHLAQVTAEPFRLDRCPLLRAQVVHIAEQDAVLLIVMHHIISDQWSFAELGRELAARYSAIRTGAEAALPSLPLQYADHASWHRSWFEGERRANELAYWSRRLDGLEPLPLNYDFPRPLAQSFRGASLRWPLDPDHIVALRGLGAAHGASLSMVLIAALNVMLHRHTGKTDIGIGVPIANRHHLASENLIGTFVNTLVFRTDLNGDPDFHTVLSRVREVSLEAFAHQDMPFEVLVRELAAKPDGSRQPLFNVMFNMVNSQARDCHFEGLTWSRLDFDRASTQFDLTFVADMLYDHALVIEYATDLFAPETVQRMGEHLQHILRAAVREPGTRVATLPLLGDAERDLLKQWSLGAVEAPTARSVAEWVANGLQPSAQQVALVFGSVQLTHQQLDEASNRLARLLRLRGIARGTRVGVCLPRSHDLVIALLAVLKTGAAYVPLDPDYPCQRLNDQIADADLALLLTHSVVKLAGEQPPRLLIDGNSALIAGTAADPLPADARLDAHPEDPAYVIYTSGSTGQPKGVAVPHRAVVNLLASMAHTPGFTAQDRLLAVTTPGFDIAVLELFLPLGMGGTVVVAGENQVTDGRALAEMMVRENITVLQATPSRWHLLLEAGWAGNPQLKALVGGEPLTPSLASQLLARCGEVWNMYGPTETTVWSSCWRVSPDAVQAIDLGRPVLNTSIQVLDEHLQPCPIGVPGEIYIGGSGVALGYHRLAALTAERFIEQTGHQDPLHARIYRTGDRGRWRHNGSLEHGGRLDDQIKLRGFRVELGEIETRLLSHPSVARAVVMLREDVPGQARLVAYVVPDGSMPSREALREHLRRWLPDHMVPGLFVEMANIPVLPNGKTNRRALPVPPSGQAGSNAPPAVPRNATETTLLAIWQAALQTDRLGIHDNFFDLGGHSILAVGVVSRIETALKRPCALALLFQHPTVAELAAALAQTQAEDTVDIPVAVLQPHGSGPGLFLLAGAEMYRRLAQQLDPAMPVYGVFSQTEIDLLRWPADVAPPEVSVETLALEYLALIRGIQPHGPYFLGGFSIGGPLAFEVAQRLQQEGEDIGLIVLLDSKLPGRGFKHLVAGVLRRLRLLRRQGLKHLLHIYNVYRHQTKHRHEPGSRRIQAYAQAIRAYDAVPSDLPVVFMQAGDDASTAPAYGWRSLVPGLTVERVPGKHMDILEPPNVEVLASLVRQHIAKAKSTGSLAGPMGSTAPQHPSSMSTPCASDIR